jgi:hypothetical protein
MSNLAPSNWKAAADALAGILQAENQALRATDFAAAAAFLPAKRAAIETIDSLKPAGPKQGISETIRRLEVLAAENRDLLNRSISIQSQLLGIIAGAARAASAFGYGNSGKSALRGGAFTLSARA